MRDFEKISFSEFKKIFGDNKSLYDAYRLPTRSSKTTAGYDFYLVQDVDMAPGEIVKIPTGIKSHFEPDEALLIIVRSSTGFKYNIRLVNQVGVVDADYYNNPDNEGHLFIKLQNESDNQLHFSAGDRLAQGVFIKYLTTDSDLRTDKNRRSTY